MLTTDPAINLHKIINIQCNKIHILIKCINISRKGINQHTIHQLYCPCYSSTCCACTSLYSILLAQASGSSQHVHETNSFQSLQFKWPAMFMRRACMPSLPVSAMLCAKQLHLCLLPSAFACCPLLPTFWTTSRPRSPTVTSFMRGPW